MYKYKPVYKIWPLVMADVSGNGHNVDAKICVRCWKKDVIIL